ncbi:MAG: 2-amino-4-hydroxy-6-hydroxymethyldihydropteridine diphosphokinase [Neisseriaceae bacterium]|nr:2-amino-4-hydroxy-6-hydroxymethyldihydropteridine diphosphokinase [Neisseriaceae bacterium]
MKKKAYIALGSNLLQPAEQLQQAIWAIAEMPDVTLLNCSRFYASKPVGYAKQPDFVNAVLAIQTNVTPQVLLSALLALEQKMGRVRLFANGPRVIDLDLLWHEAGACLSDDLVLPHPRMTTRGFVMIPLADVAPDLYLRENDALTVAQQAVLLPNQDLIPLPFVVKLNQVKQ